MSSIRYEKETVERMIRLYCRKKHQSPDGILCPECELIMRYAHDKLDKCPFGDEKGACADCKIHCYKADMREKIRIIMRYAGPRMVLFHPYDYLIHYLKDRKQKS